MQPIVPERRLASVCPTDRKQSLRIPADIRKDTADVWAIEWNLNRRIWPIELLVELIRERGLAYHHGTRCGALVESCGDFVASRSEFRVIDVTAIGDEVASVLEYRRQQD